MLNYTNIFLAAVLSVRESEKGTFYPQNALKHTHAKKRKEFRTSEWQKSYEIIHITPSPSQGMNFVPGECSTNSP
jgi:hypothetical protein